MAKRRSQKKRGVQKYTRKKIILLGVEGDNQTERKYFNHFNRMQNKYVIHFAKGNETDPVNIVANIKRDILKAGPDSFTKGDIAFAVFDTDTDPGKETIIRQAQKNAFESGIRTVISNPCFEIWFILHFDGSSAAFNSNREVIQKIRTFIPDYEKSQDIFEQLFCHIARATQRAMSLRKMHEEHGHVKILDKNPMTEIDMLVKLLLD